MRIGIPKEIKNNEMRVAMTPAGVYELVKKGHTILVEADAGVGSGFTNDDFRAAGAVVHEDPEQVWNEGDFIVKVKEPISAELQRLREGHVLFTYLHLAANRECALALLRAGTVGIAYETVQEDDGSLPLLRPMSEVAGRLSIQVGAVNLMAPRGGMGQLLGGVTSTAKSHVVVIGGGVAGEHAAANALGLGARVTVIDVNLARLSQLENRFGGNIETVFSTELSIAHALKDADLVIGSVLIPGEAAPTLVSKEMVRDMRDGSVLVDIAIDQGGCFEGSVPTTHESPTFQVFQSTYYCVANMPGAVPRTSTVALTNATLPYIAHIATEGWKAASTHNSAIARGLNTSGGEVLNHGVASALERAGVNVALAQH